MKKLDIEQRINDINIDVDLSTTVHEILYEVIVNCTACLIINPVILLVFGGIIILQVLYNITLCILFYVRTIVLIIFVVGFGLAAIASFILSTGCGTFILIGIVCWGVSYGLHQFKSFYHPHRAITKHITKYTTLDYYTPWK